MNLPSQCLSTLSVEERPLSPLQCIEMGQRITIASLPVLKTSYSRFDWYDQPQSTDLEKLAFANGEIVSLVELESNGRVGVALDICDGDIVVEAIPIDALRKSRTNSVSKTTSMRSAKPKRKNINSQVNEENVLDHFSGAKAEKEVNINL